MSVHKIVSQQAHATVANCFFESALRDNRAFSYCERLTSIVIPDSVTSIGQWAFFYCEKLESVSIGKGVESIGYQAFHYCGRLASVTFKNPDGWMAGGSAFSAAELSDPATAAEYLRGKYCDYIWLRS